MRTGSCCWIYFWSIEWRTICKEYTWFSLADWGSFTKVSQIKLLTLRGTCIVPAEELKPLASETLMHELPFPLHLMVLGSNTKHRNQRWGPEGDQTHIFYLLNWSECIPRGCNVEDSTIALTFTKSQVSHWKLSQTYMRYSSCRVFLVLATIGLCGRHNHTISTQLLGLDCYPGCRSPTVVPHHLQQQLSL